jgi:preprotein translocase YajC subunit
MESLLLAGENWIINGILIAFVVLMFVMMFISSGKQRKAQADFLSMIDTLRAGMRVKMQSGVIGRIKEIREEAPGFRVVLIETGDDKNNAVVLYDIHAVQGIINEEAIMQLNIKARLEEEKNARLAEEAELAEKQEVAYTTGVKPDAEATIEHIKLNGEDFDADKYVSKRNATASAKKTTAAAKKTGAGKSKK